MHYRSDKYGKCEKHCPQHIPIREKLGNAQKELEGPLYRAIRKAVGLFAKFRKGTPR